MVVEAPELAARAGSRVPALAWWLVYVAAAVVAMICALVVAGKEFIDLQVYRDAGRAWLDGVPLYNFGSVYGLRFIYGPMAAVAFVPLTLLSAVQAQTVWTGISVVTLWAVLWAVRERLGLPGGWLAALGLLAPALLLGPVRDTLSYGQINIVLMGLVVLDAAGVIPRRFRGVAIGIAAAIKVTPAAFGLLLLVRKDYPSIVRAGGAFLAMGALGFLVAPSDSRKYWTSEFFDTNRGGPPLYGPNQALTGLLARLGLQGRTETLVWAASALVVVVAAAYAARRFTLAGEDLLALGVVALASLLAAPIAVGHHWVYVALLLPLITTPRYARWRYPLMAAAAIFYLGMYEHVPVSGTTEAYWNLVQTLVGNSECFAAIALLVAAVVAARSRTAPPELDAVRG